MGTSQKGGCPVFHRASGRRLLSKLKVGDKQQIEHVPRFVGLINDHGAALGVHRRLLGMLDGHLPAVGHVDQKRPERPLPQGGDMRSFVIRVSCDCRQQPATVRECPGVHDPRQPAGTAWNPAAMPSQREIRAARHSRAAVEASAHAAGSSPQSRATIRRQIGPWWSPSASMCRSR